MTDTPVNTDENLSYEELMRLLDRERAEHNQLKKKRARLGITWETPNNKLQKNIAEGKPDEPYDENIADIVRNNIPYLKNREDKTVIVDPNRPTHVLIKGDNFPALMTLYPEQEGNIDVIYIDPPYNTGNKDFIYNDRYVDSENKFQHSLWLSFMARRLLLAKDLLSDSGVIFVSIDDNEQHHLRILMDEIFGASNFVANFIYDGGLKNNARFVSVGHDYIVTYAKKKSTLFEQDVYWRDQKKGLDLLKHKAETLKEEVVSGRMSTEEASKNLRKWLRENKDSLDKGLMNYSHIDKNGEVFRGGDISAPGGNGPHYDVLHPTTGLPCKPPASGWRFAWGTMHQKIEDGLIFFGKDHTTVPQFKRLLSDSNNDTQVARSYFWSERSNANKHLQAILGRNIFDFPKHVDVMKRLISLVSSPSATVLDFFAGSGTTGHAVAALNAEDGGTRKCILVTDAGKTGNANNADMSGNSENGVDIAEDITYERMRRVLTGEDWANPDKAIALNQNLEFKEVDFIPKAGRKYDKTAFEITRELRKKFIENGDDVEVSTKKATKLHGVWNKFADSKEGDLAQWD